MDRPVKGPGLFCFAGRLQIKDAKQIGRSAGVTERIDHGFMKIRHKVRKRLNIMCGPFLTTALGQIIARVAFFQWLDRFLKNPSSAAPRR